MPNKLDINDNLNQLESSFLCVAITYIVLNVGFLGKQLTIGNKIMQQLLCIRTLLKGFSFPHENAWKNLQSP